MEQYQGAEAFIEVLNANGVEHIFFNPGGDLAPIQVAILKYRMQGKPAPKLVLCLHEAVALTAAYGHYLVSGKPQVVMVHSELGTQQVGGALHNAQWGRIPVIIWAGLQAGPERRNWRNEPHDQNSMVRICVKWDHEISPEENIHDVLQQAFKTAFTEPHGPVYLSYPRETLSNKVDKVAIQPSAINAVTEASPADIESLGKIADILLDAEAPLIVVGHTGRYPESIASLVELAETLCAPVLPGLTRVNFPTTHPLCAGLERMGGGRAMNPHITDADAVLVIDYDMPYVPADGRPGENARIIHIDTDPLTQGRPLWGRGADIFINADSREAIPALNRILRQKLTPEKQGQLRERFSQLEERHARERKEWREYGKSKSSERPISPDWLCHCIAEIIDEETIIVNHLITQSSSVPEQIDRTKPATLLGCAGGSIMWAPGAALGAKVAAPDKTVVSLMTDGGFVWSSPVAALWSAKSYKAPFLSVIFNNQSYGAIRAIIERLSETGLSDETAFDVGVDIYPPPDYAMIAQACGGYGRKVEDPTEVLPVLKEAMAEVHKGRPALVDVILARG